MFFNGMAANGCRVSTPALTPDLRDDEITTFLVGRRRLDRVAVRHTVGLDDQVEGEGGVADPAQNSGARYFKLKLNGDPEADAARLIRIGNELVHATLRLPGDTRRQRAIRRSRGPWRAGRSPGR